MRRAKGDCDHAEQLLDDCKVAPEDLMVSLENLTTFLLPYLERLGDKRLHQHGENFIRGLLSDLDRKSVEGPARWELREEVERRLGELRRNG